MKIQDLNIKRINIWFLLAFIFIAPVFYYNGVNFGIQTLRISQEQFFQVGVTVLSIFIIENIFVALFLALTVFLYFFFDFTGGNYLINVFMGCLLYQIVYKFIEKKEDVDMAFKAIMLVCLVNIVMMLFQVLDFDFIYNKKGILDPVGFMGIKAALGLIVTGKQA